MRRPFMEQGRRSTKGLCRYQRIKIFNEQKYLERVMKYIFPYVEHRVPRYRWQRKRGVHQYFRRVLSGRAVEEVFQFHRPWRGNGSFSMSSFHPQYGLADSSSEETESE